jgi:hypothetical protein
MNASRTQSSATVYFELPWYRLAFPVPVASGKAHAGTWQAVLEVDRGLYERYAAIRDKEGTRINGVRYISRYASRGVMRREKIEDDRKRPYCPRRHSLRRKCHPGDLQTGRCAPCGPRHGGRIVCAPCGLVLRARIAISDRSIMRPHQHGVSDDMHMGAGLVVVTSGGGLCADCDRHAQMMMAECVALSMGSAVLVSSACLAFAGLPSAYDLVSATRLAGVVPQRDPYPPKPSQIWSRAVRRGSVDATPASLIAPAVFDDASRPCAVAAPAPIRLRGSPCGRHQRVADERPLLGARRTLCLTLVVWG